MFSQHIILALFWTGYFLLHSLLADMRVKQKMLQLTGRFFKYYRSLYNAIALVLLATLMIWQIKLPSKRIWAPFIPQYILGALMMFLGFTGMVLILKKYFFSSNGFRDLFLEGGKPVLVTNGLHRWVRHPLYMGTFLFIWGFFLLVPAWSLLITNILITVYTLLAIQLEEKKLVSIFGEQYIQYQKEVPMIWPRMGKIIT